MDSYLFKRTRFPQRIRTAYWYWAAAGQEVRFLGAAFFLLYATVMSVFHKQGEDWLSSLIQLSIIFLAYTFASSLFRTHGVDCSIHCRSATQN